MKKWGMEIIILMRNNVIGVIFWYADDIVRIKLVN